MAKKKPEQGRLFPETEVEAYGFIRDQLRDLGWVVKNPNLNTGGQVWTQNQCLAHPEIKRAFGAKRPENVIKVAEEAVWIIEAKSKRADLDRALEEATDYYAKKINDDPASLRAVLATGVAGNEESGYLVKTVILLDAQWRVVTVNGQEATGLLSPKDVKALLDQRTSDVYEFAPSQRQFLRAAERINGILHLGGINKNDRAKVMAALLLSVIEEPPNLDTKLPVLIGEINTRSEAILRQHGKPDFAPFVKILNPTNRKNHVKFKSAVVRTIQELRNLNIRSAMNSSTDVLGQFYEVFLKYGNGAKDIGIVLTPRHVTRFAVEAVGASMNDIVLDPACGTGGFLVAAFDHVSRTNPSAIDRFKRCGLFGIEQESSVAALAIVNMIFRGDGKHHIEEADCFSTYLAPRTINGHPSAVFSDHPPRAGDEPVTRVLMNPPFALKGKPEKEYLFVSRALTFMANGGILFSLLPLDAMFGAHEEKIWRANDLLGKSTLLAVISFPDELFYPTAQKQVAGIIVRKGFPHPREQPVFWLRIQHDGHLKVKSKRLPASELEPPRIEVDEIPIALPALRNFLANPTAYAINEPQFCKTAPIDFNDPLLETLPEVYLESRRPEIANLCSQLDVQLRENIGALIEVDLRYGGGGESIIDAALQASARPSPTVIPAKLPRFGRFALRDLFNLCAGDYHSLGTLSPGSVPVVSCSDVGSAVIGGYDVPDTKVYCDALTIAYNGTPLATKIHPYPFAAKDDVAVATPKGILSVESLIFIQMMVNSERWRFSYYRKCFHAKMELTTIPLPVVNGGKLHTEFMEVMVQSRPYWAFLAPRFANWAPSAPR